MPAPRMRTTPLPGIGVQYDFTTREHRHLSVIAHRDGTRTVNVYRGDDPDACAQSLHLTEVETASLIDALMPAHHSPNVLHTTDLGLVAERIELSAHSYWNGRLLGETRMRTDSQAPPSSPYCAAPGRYRPRRPPSGSRAATRSSSSAPARASTRPPRSSVGSEGGVHSAVFLIEFGAIILGLGLLGRLMRPVQLLPDTPVPARRARLRQGRPAAARHQRGVRRHRRRDRGDSPAPHARP